MHPYPHGIQSDVTTAVRYLTVNKAPIQVAVYNQCMDYSNTASKSESNLCLDQATTKTKRFVIFRNKLLVESTWTLKRQLFLLPYC